MSSTEVYMVRSLLYLSTSDKLCKGKGKGHPRTDQEGPEVE
jgi:hypothetical protein